jgi:hypothetical protein
VAPSGELPLWGRNRISRSAYRHRPVTRSPKVLGLSPHLVGNELSVVLARGNVAFLRQRRLDNDTQSDADAHKIAAGHNPSAHVMPVIIRTTSLHPFDAISYDLCQCSGTEQIRAWLGSPGGSHFREFSKRQDHCSGVRRDRKRRAQRSTAASGSLGSLQGHSP